MQSSDRNLKAVYGGQPHDRPAGPPEKAELASHRPEQSGNPQPALTPEAMGKPTHHSSPLQPSTRSLCGGVPWGLHTDGIPGTSSCSCISADSSVPHLSSPWKAPSELGPTRGPVAWGWDRVSSPTPTPKFNSPTPPHHHLLSAESGSFSCIRQPLGQQEEGMVRSQRAGVRERQRCSYQTAACRLSTQSPAPRSVHTEPSPRLCPHGAQAPAPSTGSPVPSSVHLEPSPQLCPQGAQPPTLSTWRLAPWLCPLRAQIPSSVHAEPSPQVCPHGA